MAMPRGRAAAMHRLMTGTTRSPSGTPSAPLGQKSFWTSTMSSAACASGEEITAQSYSNTGTNKNRGGRWLSGQNWLSVTTTGGPLSTDLYELTMMAGYYSAGFTGQA